MSQFTTVKNRILFSQIWEESVVLHNMLTTLVNYGQYRGLVYTNLF